MQRLLFGRLLEKMEQMRTEFTDKMQALEHSIIGERGQIRTELTYRMQTLEQTLIEEIQKLQSSQFHFTLNEVFVLK